ncbi:hypothetical protein Tco_0153867 [Tanacetum coccineum]
MFEVSTILEDDSADLVFGGANRLVKVSLSNSTTSLFRSTFVELIEEIVAFMFGEVLGEGASLSIEVEEEEDTPTISGGGRVTAEMGFNAALGFLKYSSNIGWNNKSQSFFIGGLVDVDIAWLSTSLQLMCQEVKL